MAPNLETSTFAGFMLMNLRSVTYSDSSFPFLLYSSLHPSWCLISGSALFKWNQLPQEHPVQKREAFLLLGKILRFIKCPSVPVARQAPQSLIFPLCLSLDHCWEKKTNLWTFLGFLFVFFLV